MIIIIIIIHNDILCCLCAHRPVRLACPSQALRPALLLSLAARSRNPKITPALRLRALHVLLQASSKCILGKIKLTTAIMQPQVNMRGQALGEEVGEEPEVSKWREKVGRWQQSRRRNPSRHSQSKKRSRDPAIPSL